MVAGRALDTTEVLGHPLQIRPGQVPLAVSVDYEIVARQCAFSGAAVLELEGEALLHGLALLFANLLVNLNDLVTACRLLNEVSRGANILHGERAGIDTGSIPHHCNALLTRLGLNIDVQGIQRGHHEEFRVRRRDRLVLIHHRAAQIVQLTLAVRHYTTLGNGMKFGRCHYARLFGGHLLASCQAASLALLEILSLSLRHDLVLMPNAVIGSG